MLMQELITKTSLLIDHYTEFLNYNNIEEFIDKVELTNIIDRLHYTKDSFMELSLQLRDFMDSYRFKV